MKKIILFSLCSIIFVVALKMDIANKADVLSEKNDVMTNDLSPTESNSAIQKRSSIHLLLKTESAKIGMVDELPDQTEIRLKNLAMGLGYSDLIKLRENSLDTSLSGEERMLSVYLLGLSQHEYVATFLEEIALTPTNSNENSYSNNFEAIIRLQAIEGIQNRSDKSQSVRSLYYVASRISDSQLLDRTQRAISHYTKGSDNLETQDLKALKKLIR
ncbi:MAG: hypothetical protein A4S09_03750 [Proteobacteria bacterium SG_bin7]|nr:MAG: hypothetical protein A4S09_03750 [Proteobacteria bacterium SG_bin7]